MVDFSYASGVFVLRAEQLIKADLDEVWDFFSSPLNLEKITPERMGFSITNSPSSKTYAGQIITYKVRIFPLFKSNWVTEITHVRNQDYFVDEQRFGPYSMWHHEHIFEEKQGGVLMKDIIHFKMPLGLLGRIAFHVYAKYELKKIFKHRFDFVEGCF